jgi:hypothetical protein
MSRDNPLWGAPRIHGELLKLGMTISQASVASVETPTDIQPRYSHMPNDALVFVILSRKSKIARS